MQVSGTAGVKPTGRIAYLDAAKGCAILSVILSHLWIPELTPFLFSFHMPLFFILSGYFLKREDNPRIWVCKRSRQILVPFALTAGVLGLARLALLHCAGELSLSSALGVAKGIMAEAQAIQAAWGPFGSCRRCSWRKLPFKRPCGGGSGAFCWCLWPRWAIALSRCSGAP